MLDTLPPLVPNSLYPLFIFLAGFPYHVGFSIKGDGVDGGEDNGDDGCNSFLLVSKICIFDKSLYTTVTNYA